MEEFQQIELPLEAYEWRFRLKDGKLITGSPKIDEYRDQIFQIFLTSKDTTKSPVILILKPGEAPYRSTQRTFSVDGQHKQQQILGIEKNGIGIYAVIEEDGTIYLSSSKDI